MNAPTAENAGRPIGVRWADGAGGVESGRLSLSGLTVRSSRLLPIGSLLVAELFLTGSEPALRLPSEVARATPVDGDGAKRSDLEIRFDAGDIDQFQKLAELVVVLATGQGGILLRPAPVSKRTETGSPLLARIEDLEQRIDRLTASIEAGQAARLEAERSFGDSIRRLERRLATLEAVAPTEDTSRLGAAAAAGEPLRPAPRATSSLPPPARRTTATSVPPVAKVKSERLDPSEFAIFLQSGQPIERSARFNQFNPTNPVESQVASWLESAEDLSGLERLARGHMPEAKLLEILQLFYRRGLIDFQ